MFIVRGLVTGLAAYAMQAPQLDTVLSQAGRYVQDYERALGMTIAGEEYVQRVPLQGPGTLFLGTGGVERFPRLEYRWQRLLSDFLMGRLGSEGDQWVGFRAVREVNGHQVRDRQLTSNGGASFPRKAPVTTSAASPATRMSRRSRCSCCAMSIRPASSSSGSMMTGWRG